MHIYMCIGLATFYTVLKSGGMDNITIFSGEAMPTASYNYTSAECVLRLLCKNSFLKIKHIVSA